MKQIPEESLEIFLASISESTLKQYNVALRKWWEFCMQRQKNPFSPDVPNIINFLCKEFADGKKHGTINSFRSAISLIMGPEISEDFRLKRFLKGIYNMRPNNPKYDVTWDPEIVLKFFSEKAPNEDLSLEEIAKKLITLMAIVTGHRMQTFSLINIEDIDIKQKNKIVIKIPGKIKTSGLNKKQPTLVLPFFFKDIKICAATTLLSYLDKTKTIRKSRKRLFLSFKKPYKEVSSQTLSHWVRETLKLSGIDTDIFSAHSTRHASTSAVNRKGISVDLIRKTAGWSRNSSTFAKFYNRDIIENEEDFANAIYDRN